MNWGTALSIVLTSRCSPGLQAVDHLALAVPSPRRWHRASYFLLPSIGIMLAVLVMGVLGAFSQQATGNWNIALLGAHISGWGSSRPWAPPGRPAHQRHEPVSVHRGPPGRAQQRPQADALGTAIATVILGVGGTALAIAGILSTSARCSATPATS